MYTLHFGALDIMPTVNVYSQVLPFQVMFVGSLVTTAWRVLRLRMEGRPSDT